MTLSGKRTLSMKLRNSIKMFCIYYTLFTHIIHFSGLHNKFTDILKFRWTRNLELTNQLRSHNADLIKNFQEYRIQSWDRRG